MLTNDLIRFDLDMIKAYDKVQFGILLNKLYNMGIHGKSYEWEMESYLKKIENK